MVQVVRDHSFSLGVGAPGSAYCRICECADHALLWECPGHPVTSEDQRAIVNRKVLSLTPRIKRAERT